MNRRRFAVAALLAAACLLAASVTPAHAQGGGGRGRGGRFGMFNRTTHQITLAALPEVEADLKLTDEQKTKIATLSEEFDEERRSQFGRGGGGGGGGGGEEGRAARAKMNADFAAKLNEALEEPQQKRIQEIYVQVNGTGLLSDDAIATALAITDEQKESLQTAIEDQRDAMQDAFEQDLSGEERIAKMAELSKARDEALLAVLTDEQKTKFEGMKGEKLEIDMTQLRQGRGGRGGGFGGGGGGGGRRGGRGGGDNGDGAAEDGGDAGGRPAAEDDGA